MKKCIKPSTIKKIVVKCANFWMDEYSIDSEIFDDVYMEAATRSVEKRKNLSGFQVAVIIVCWEKKDFKRPEKHYGYNTYKVFINAGMYNKAEILRQNFMKMQGIDLQKESLRGDNKDNGSGTDKSNPIGK